MDTSDLSVHIDEETQKVSFTVKIILADVFGTHKYGAQMSAWEYVPSSRNKTLVFS
jgi:hypothetical protein